MIDLFQWQPPYPSAPGYTEPTTSREAALAIAAKVTRLQDDIIALLRKHGNLTAHELACEMKMSKDITSPRLSELREMGRIVPSGQRRKNESGRSAIAWRSTE
jgi:predicted ArsR family transcriptional regulator